ncbi:LCP family protein, partial [Staphylococcus aureus]|nr:LCP family protein [Staphylococcus aureus]
LKMGNHRLNGKELLGYARFRLDPEGELGRVRRQQQVMQTLKNEMVNFRTVVKLAEGAGMLRGCVYTSLPEGGVFHAG